MKKKNEKVMLNEVEMAEFLCISVSTLRKSRLTKQGRKRMPPSVKIGKCVRYPREAAEKWIAERLR
jgi:predicted DNA-binding transcriptional regulator AlpA